MCANGSGVGANGVAVHISTPKAVATVKMSLSPRPERLTINIWSASSVGATFSALAMACADSSAGMIPSSAESFWQLASASSSVIGIDRKSVVTGKSVAGRVQLGGRRFLKQKNKKKHKKAQV